MYGLKPRGQASSLNSEAIDKGELGSRQETEFDPSYAGGGAENGAFAPLAPTAPRAARLVAAAQARGLVRPFEFDSPQGILIKNGPVALMRTDPQIVWWRCGESNSGPKHIPGGFLQAQLPVRFRSPCAWQQARSFPAGSILAHGIPATSVRASPSMTSHRKREQPAD